MMSLRVFCILQKNTHLFCEASAVEVWDGGIRQLLNVDFDYAEALNQTKKYYDVATLYIIKDDFECAYMGFQLPDQKHYVHIGPFIEVDPLYLFRKMVEEIEIHVVLLDELKKYYYSVPYIREPNQIENVVVHYLNLLYEGQEVAINRIGIYYKNPFYHPENAMLDAVRTGDMEEVLKKRQKLEHYKLEGLDETSPQFGKRMLIVQNTLLRKAVQKESVHPVHIDFMKLFKKCQGMTPREYRQLMQENH